VEWEPIHKQPRRGAGFNLADYDLAVREFSWDRARAELDGLPGGRGLNIAYEAVDRHAAGAYQLQEQLDALSRDAAVEAELATIRAQMAPHTSKRHGKGSGGA